MFFANQRTISNSVCCFGIGLHSGKVVNMRLCQAPEDSGVIFRKIDKLGKMISEIPVSYDSVSQTIMSTTISSKDNKHSVGTVEHLMAAIWGCRIDNIIIEIDGDEVPIMDGSSEQFVFMIECAGIKYQNRGRRFIEIIKEVTVKNEDEYVSISPADHFSINMEIDYTHKIIGSQKFMFNSPNICFKKQISRARTFGLLKDVQKMYEMGLAKGGSLDNAVVVDDENILNDGGLRYNDEFVRHKVLDAIGDLYMVGCFIKGHFDGKKSGHTSNNKLLHTLMNDKSSWRMIQLPDSK